MAKTQADINFGAESLLAQVAKLKVKDLEAFARELNGIIVRKKSKGKENKVRTLLAQVNQTVLPSNVNARYFELLEKLQSETISATEHKEFLRLVEKEEKLRNKRVQLMIEMAQLRNMPLSRLMEEMGLNPVGNG